MGVAVGDAAATSDPLASDGITAALAGRWDAVAVALAALKGDPAVAQHYAHRLRRGFVGYLENRAAYYEMEGPHFSFWRRRQGGDRRSGFLGWTPQRALVMSTTM